MEEAISLRAEEDVDAALKETSDGVKSEDETMDSDEAPKTRRPMKGIRIPTPEEVNDAFQSIITLRYSQPTHLAGSVVCLLIFSQYQQLLQGNVTV